MYNIGEELILKNKQGEQLKIKQKIARKESSNKEIN